jgi:hypothetical protein
MAIDRRGFLGALALAPAALAGCAGGSSSAGARPAASGGARAGDVPAGAVDGTRAAAVAAVRSFPLAADVEPAFVFRATAARPREP